jgi:sodium/potassium-transporting ATPase subunit alpha
MKLPPTRIQHLTSGAALESLRSRREGLSAQDAAGRLHEFGPNAVERVSPTPLPVQFAREFVHLFAIVLWIAAALAFVADVLQPGQGMAALGWAVIGVIAINGIFSFWQVYQAERAIDSLRRLLPSGVLVMRDGRATQVQSADLVPGDVIVLVAGDRVPADCRIIEAFDVRADMSTVTGEARPANRYAEPDDGEDLLECRNVLLAGTSVVTGRAMGVVFATGMRTEFGQIARLAQSASEPLSPIQREIARVSRVVAMLATLLGIVFFAIGQAIGLSFWQNLVFAIGILVANVPEGLLPTVTLAMAMASTRMAKQRTLVRHLPAIEALGAATVICTDKTGTLTENHMSAEQLFVGGRGLPVKDVLVDRGAVSIHRRLFEIALCCEDVRSIERAGHDEFVGDPMEIALVEMARRALGDWAGPRRVDEVPFDTDRKRLATVHEGADGRIVYVKGAPEAVLPLCAFVSDAGEIIPLSPAARRDVEQAQDAMAAGGLRVLAMAWRTVSTACTRAELETGLIFAGLIGLEDPPRPEVPAAVERCHRAGIKVIMITGDHPATAVAIGRQVGLVRSENPRVITGGDLRRLSDVQLQLALDAPEILFARIGADQKLRIVRALQQKKAVVAVTGDGVNDAPALKAADVGIAMGVVGTDVAKDAADMILLDDNFATIVVAIEEGRAVFDNIQKFLTYILTSNIPELVPYLAFVLFQIPLPLTIIQILAVDLGTDMVPALGLGAERPEQGIMERPPRSRQHRLLDVPLLTRAYLFLGVMEAAAAMAAFFFVLYRGGWIWGQALASDDLLYRLGTTACLTAIVLMQVVNVFVCRSAMRTSLELGAFRNRFIAAGVAVELILILLIDYTAVGHTLFDTASIPWSVWFFVLPFAVAMLLMEEGRKMLSRIRSRHLRGDADRRLTFSRASRGGA